MNLDSLSRLESLDEIATNNGLEKIIIFQKNKILLNDIINYGYEEEGIIDGFFNGASANMLIKYLVSERKQTNNLDNENNILKEICKNKPTNAIPSLPDNYIVRSATEKDISQIVDVFKKVFKSYPTPMYDKNYVKKAINDNVELAIVKNENGEIVGLSSAEIDYKRKNAEITDCATLPSERGKGIMNILIQFLEDKMKEKEILNLFSIARARSFGMNKVLYNLNYEYRGRLINNVHIAGNWENMNIWVKQI